MLTKEQALTANELHFIGAGGCTKTTGLRGKEYIHLVRVRRNGATKTWKTRPNEWRMPIRYGWRDKYSITQDDAHNYHIAQECPLIAGRIPSTPVLVEANKC